jgi:hypothetical protein
MNPAVEVTHDKNRTKSKEDLMKNKIVSLFVLSITLLCSNMGFAQTARHPGLAIKVPFEFVVGNQTFPAGTYEFHSLLNAVAGKDTIDVLVVRSTEGGLYRAIVTHVVGGGDEASRPRVVFTRSSGRVFLSEVWESGKPAGCRLMDRQDETETAASENDKVTLIASADWR